MRKDRVTPSPPPPDAPAIPAPPRSQMPRARFPRRAMAGVVGLLALFILLAWTAVQSKSPTYDEPLHAVGAWLHLHHLDFRVNPEDPPLWHYWAALPNGRDALRVDRTSEDYRALSQDISGEWKVVADILYRAEGVDPDGLITRSRAMMLVLGVMLGIVLAWWSWKAGGAVAMVAATTLFALDPNFLGHAPLVKNDVTLALTMLGVAFALWRAGIRLTPWNAFAIALLCGAGLNVKFSAVLLGPIVAVVLVVRALLSEPWQLGSRALRTRGSKLLAAAALCAAAAVVSYVVIWACYGFRFRPTPDAGVSLNTRMMIDAAAMNELALAHPGRPPTTQEVRAWRPGPFLRTAMFLETHRLLPQAWINGLLYTYQSAVTRRSYLLGDYSTDGWWYYFPFAMLVKTPLATLAAAGLSLIVLALSLRQRGRALLRDHGWLAVCIIVPAGTYMLSAMTSNLNIGLRHVLPAYPFIYLGIGLAVAAAWRLRPRSTRIATGVLGLVLAIEAFIAFPNFIAFFNAAAGGSRGGLHLLGDSNLDWGQDLKLLKQWQDEHPQQKLYLSYFGFAEPTYYGIEYANVPGGYQFYAPPAQIPTTPGVMAISATNLQGIYQDRDDPRRRLYEFFLEREPFEVLGGTIYLYDLSPETLIALHMHLRGQ